MRLISLTCDQPTFKPITFNEKGLTLIIGDSSEEKEGSSNGVGKTLALGLIHHCLGANADKRLSYAVPDWWFTLLFAYNGKEYRVSRTGDGKKITLNDEPIKLKKYKQWLDTSGLFRLDSNIPLLSFRSLIKRFARYLREDCLDPLRTNKEIDFDAKLRTLYLLGLECSLVVNKRDHKKALDEINKAITNWQKDTILKDMFRAGAQPKLRLEWLDRQLSILKEDLSQFQIAENYRALEMETGELTSSIRNIEKDISVIDFQVENIEKTIAHHPDISKQDLMDLYQGLQAIFKPEALAHFEAVEKFHHSLSINRRTRLMNDKINLLNKKSQLEEKRRNLSLTRDQKIQYLQGKRALDEYAAIAKQVANFEEERERLSEFLNFTSKLQEKAQRIREKRVEEDRLATYYTQSEPLHHLDIEFTKLAETLYPRVPAGIVLESNTGDNQIRYDLTVQIEGDDSDGINAARILCFDWLIWMKGANHTIDMLWHDNRLFADIDPGARANWFSFIHKKLEDSNKQYIATLNTENYDAMLSYLSDGDRKYLMDSVVLKLNGDLAKNKLLGIQFGKSPEIK
ncbi:hypothetical protein Xbed_02618 [Xenorhabdus beddingii]|uniref:DUF2326 domain-containing protein n=2 Tax=Xenorhabdus beddingii TaxID=40578 RepID=A0A1Y2SNF2_9GAMM|nr:hypothetical protein Xbed_02618 [Xenorhabdus beddingii]